MHLKILRDSWTVRWTFTNVSCRRSLEEPLKPLMYRSKSLLAHLSIAITIILDEPKVGNWMYVWVFFKYAGLLPDCQYGSTADTDEFAVRPWPLEHSPSSLSHEKSYHKIQFVLYCDAIETVASTQGAHSHVISITETSLYFQTPASGWARLDGWVQQTSLIMHSFHLLRIRNYRFSCSMKRSIRWLRQTSRLSA